MPPRQQRNASRRTDAPHFREDVVELGKLFDRPPPHSDEAETGVIGAVLFDPRRIDDVALVLKPEHFWSPGKATIFAAIVALHNENKQVEINLLIERLKSTGDLEMIGGKLTLVDMLEATPAALNAVPYAELVRDYATKRKLLAASAETMRDVFDLAGEEQDATKQLVERAESRVMLVSEDRAADQVTEISGTLGELLEMINSAGDKPRGLRTGYHDLDAEVQILPGQVVVIGARPSMGKSALATSLCENFSIGQGAAKGCLVTLEMNRLEVGARLLSSLTGISINRLTGGFGLSADASRKVTEAMSELHGMELFVDDTPARSMSDIAAVCRRLKRDRKRGLDYVMVDYLQLIEPEKTGRNDTRESQIADISRKLKKLARELQVPVFVLSQLNRAAADGKDQRPRMQHLRESGAIEQDADHIWFVHREEYYATNELDKAKVAGKAELIVAKQRNGWTGTVHLQFVKERCRFENYSSKKDFD